MDIEDEEILEFLKKYNVIVVKRFKKRIKELKNTLFLLTFERKEVPKELFFAYECNKFFEYVPPVPRSYKCQTFGHIADSFKKKVRCVRCDQIKDKVKSLSTMYKKT